jgi:hypothetical protein
MLLKKELMDEWMSYEEQFFNAAHFASSLFLKIVVDVHLSCAAMRKAITGYPEEVKGLLPQLFVMWFAHLADSIQIQNYV